MNTNEFNKILKKDKELIDKKIKEFFADRKNSLDEAVFYAIDGGKRIRPILYLETIKMLRKDDFTDQDINFAISIEMIHSYSLIHDDMPALDNDDYRRGRESVHKKFGEDIALLAGDYLLNTAYENILSFAKDDLNKAKAGFYLAKCAGKSGMIEGQYYDLFRKETYDLDYVFNVYEKKTAALFKASLLGPGLSEGCDQETLNYLEDFGKYLGLSFQLQDDLLEDEIKDELNILNVIEKDEALEYLHKFNQRAKNAIKNLENNGFHAYLIDYLSTRTI